eukprot:3159363-Amphidinium_carterae.1
MVYNSAGLFTLSGGCLLYFVSGRGWVVAFTCGQNFGETVYTSDCLEVAALVPCGKGWGSAIHRMLIAIGTHDVENH